MYRSKNLQMKMLSLQVLQQIKTSRLAANSSKSGGSFMRLALLSAKQGFGSINIDFGAGYVGGFI
ncbi:hypothetical protein SAMN05518848_106237 [Paenibacillus sp. PDC88]|nr:hypothetical protein SAMN05518848_106237 [Paenibacillus sp. PDC88]